MLANSAHLTVIATDNLTGAVQGRTKAFLLAIAGSPTVFIAEGYTDPINRITQAALCTRTFASASAAGVPTPAITVILSGAARLRSGALAFLLALIRAETVWRT